MKLAFPTRRAVSRTLACDPLLAWDILSDYAAWPEWLPLVTQATERAREKNFALAEVELAPFPGRKVTIECAHAPGTRVLAKSTIGQDPEFILDWTVAPEGAGQCRVTVKCTWVHTPANVKAAMGAVDPNAWLNGLAAQVASYAADVNTGPTDPAILLEIHETESGLVCWYRGRKYAMTEAS